MYPNTYTNVETFTNRLATFNGTSNKKLELILTAETTLPICITLDDKINPLTFKTEPAPSLPAAITKLENEEFKQKEGKERYVYMGAVKSPITYNILMLYYDRKWKDIILVPDLSFLDISSPNKLFDDIRCYRIGSGIDLPNSNANNHLPSHEVNRYQLAEGKTGLAAETKLVSLPGYGLFTDHYGGGFEEMINNSINLIHDNRKLGILIKLGTAAQVFTNPNVPIPTYLFFQYGVLDYGLKYLNVMKTENKTLWVTIKF